MSSPHSKFQYRILDENDFEAVWQVLGNDFTYNEPVSAKLKLSSEYPLLVSYRSWKIKLALTQLVSMGAFDRTSGILVGCAIVHLSKEMANQESPVNLDDAPLNYRQMLELVYLCHEGVVERMGNDAYMEITYMSCRQDYCGNGIGRILFEKAIENAQQKSCKKVFVIAFNHYVQRMAARNGFQQLKEVVYSDYIDPLTKTKVLENMPHPHNKAATLIKYL